MSTRPRITHETRSKRARRQLWLRIGVGLFLLLFVFSVAGFMMVTTVTSR